MRKPQVHHDLAQKYQEAFEDLGLDIHDPAFTRWVEGGPHLKWSSEFNQEWGRFFDRFPTPTLRQVLDQFQKMRNDPRFR